MQCLLIMIIGCINLKVQRYRSQVVGTAVVPFIYFPFLFPVFDILVSRFSIASGWVIFHEKYDADFFNGWLSTYDLWNKRRMIQDLLFPYTRPFTFHACILFFIFPCDNLRTGSHSFVVYTREMSPPIRGTRSPPCYEEAWNLMLQNG